jgi:hypothetical protein
MRLRECGSERVWVGESVGRRECGPMRVWVGESVGGEVVQIWEFISLREYFIWAN